MMGLTMLVLFAVPLGLTPSPALASRDSGCASGCRQALETRFEQFNACMASCLQGRSAEANEIDPFMCRFGAVEGGAPVLLAATRDDCALASGVAMTPGAADGAASE
jgi:hypothetical protein